MSLIGHDRLHVSVSNEFFSQFFAFDDLRKFFTSKANPFGETTFEFSASRTVGNAFICLGFLGCGAS